MEYSSFSIDEQPYTSLFKIYDHEFYRSHTKGLIDISNLSIAGDGNALLQHLHANGSTVFANVPKIELLPVIVTVTFPSLTVTSVMILPENAFTMATTYIYWLQRTQKATCLYFLYSLLHQSMILMGFWKLTFVSKLFFLIFMSENGF